MLPQLKNWGLHIDAQKLSDPTFTAASFAKFGSQDKDGSGGMTFKQFVSWCMAHGPQPHLDLSRRELSPGKFGYDAEADAAEHAPKKLEAEAPGVVAAETSPAMQKADASMNSEDNAQEEAPLGDELAVAADQEEL